MTVLLHDDFNHLDNADLGTTWDVQSGSDGFKISSNAALPTNSANDSAELDNSVSFPNNQWVEATLLNPTGLGGVGAGNGVTLRGAVGASRTGYRGVANTAGYELVKFVSGSSTSLGSGSGTTFASGDRLYFEFQGSTPVGKKNTTAGAGGTPFGSFSTDSAIASGKVGPGFSSPDNSTTGINELYAGDFSTGTFPPVPESLHTKSQLNALLVN